MLRLRTIYASSSSSAAYFAKYLAQAPGEQPGVWTGRQAAGLGLAGTVTVADLEFPPARTPRHAATEHGWQSDTVTACVALASPETTRRGLYVAATRDRERNTICVVTASPDVREARNVLENVLAADRDDIPAVTQRRTLAAINQPRPQPPPAPAPRDPRLVPQATPRDDHRPASRRTRRRRRRRTTTAARGTACRAAAGAGATVVAADGTRPTEPGSPTPKPAVGYARSRLAASYENLQGAGAGASTDRARRLVDANKERLETAQADLQRIEADCRNPAVNASPTSTASSTTSTPTAWIYPDPRHLGPQSHPHHDLDQLRHLDTALNRWQRWATGQPITTAELDDTNITLEDAGSSPGTAAYHSLGHTARSWAAEPESTCRHPCATSSTRRPVEDCQSTSNCRASAAEFEATTRRRRRRRSSQPGWRRGTRTSP